MNSQFTKIVRILLGVILLVFGLNKFHPFIPLPQPPEAAANFMNSLAETGYVLYVVAFFEVAIGVMLLAKKWVPFAILLLAPISLNILLFHMFLDVPAIATAIVVVALNGILIYKYRQKYSPLFS
ncbi:DoxX family membrane protein [Flavobacterium beibuense]|uniref:DoxX protein n=1 Tax=Flavobacterium beibuense TaxID=657326 RepID=A0A444W744_9FLAO|nr:DoxX family membrane protein [Flavobacterium beibuense]RYJ41603.1 DoxX protein [Flavobacterium beibuense]